MKREEKIEEEAKEDDGEKEQKKTREEVGPLLEDGQSQPFTQSKAKRWMEGPEREKEEKKKEKE